MPATAKKDAPKFGSDFVSKMESFESLCFERFAEGRNTQDCLEPHESSAAEITFGWSSEQLRRRVHQLSRIFEAKQIVGSAKDREQAIAAEKEAIEAERKLLEENEIARRKMEKDERKARAECIRLANLNGAVASGLGLLQQTLPSHVLSQINALEDDLGRNEQSDVSVCKGEIAHIETILRGPTIGPGVTTPTQALAMWHGMVRRIDSQFLASDGDAKGLRTTKKFEAWCEAAKERLELLKKDLPKLEQAVAAKRAEIDKLRNYYIDKN